MKNFFLQKAKMQLLSTRKHQLLNDKVVHLVQFV